MELVAPGTEYRFLRKRSNCRCKLSNSWSDKLSKSIRLLRGTSHTIDEFIQLQMDRLGITFLSILDEKHHVCEIGALNQRRPAKHDERVNG